MADRILRQRIINLFESGDVGAGIKANDLAALLQKMHPEYARKKKELPKRVAKVMRDLDLEAPDGAKGNDGGAGDGHAEQDTEAEIDALIDAVGPGEQNLLNQRIRKRYASRVAVGGGQDSEPSSAAEASGGSSRHGKRQRKRKSSSRREEKEAKRRGAAGEGGKSSSSLTVSSSGSARVVPLPKMSYSDLGGVETVLQDIRELIEYPLTHPEIYTHLGVEPPRGILLHGPPGCGKTLLANAIAGQVQLPYYRISAPEVVSGMSGESEQRIRDLFREAVQEAPSLIFIDEIDAITPKRESAARGMERRIVAQLLTSMDSLTLDNTEGKPVLVIGATNRPHSLDPALRRAGRFDREICLSVPDSASRMRILQVLAGKMRLAEELDLAEVARLTPGFVGADLAALTKEAAVIAINRVFHVLAEEESQNANADEGEADEPSSSSGPARPRSGSLDRRSAVSAALSAVEPFTEEQLQAKDLCVTMSDFVKAVKKVQPSAKREGFATAPNVTWADVGALEGVRDDLELSIMQPIRHPERFEAVGLQVPAGVLLYGPPGCGKTLLAKAIAHESGANFISVKGPELLDKYVGESEKAVRKVFHRAQMSSPCIIFFDELDALCPRRGSSGSASGVSERVVNQLLTELDGLESRRSVFVIAATNRPDIIDPAMLRPGRLDKLLYVPLPGPADRSSILKTLTRKTPLAEGAAEEIEKISRTPACEGYSGADLALLVREATIFALREDQTPPIQVSGKNFHSALAKVLPSVSEDDQRVYDLMQGRLRQVRISSSGNGDDSGGGGVPGAEM
eukprot:g3703.t1